MQYINSKTFRWATFQNKAIAANVYKQSYQNLFAKKNVGS